MQNLSGEIEAASKWVASDLQRWRLTPEGQRIEFPSDNFEMRVERRQTLA
jgi:hypothetical protein